MCLIGQNLNNKIQTKTKAASWLKEYHWFIECSNQLIGDLFLNGSDPTQLKKLKEEDLKLNMQGFLDKSFLQYFKKIFVKKLKMKIFILLIIKSKMERKICFIQIKYFSLKMDLLIHFKKNLVILISLILLKKWKNFQMNWFMIQKEKNIIILLILIKVLSIEDFIWVKWFFIG